MAEMNPIVFVVVSITLTGVSLLASLPPAHYAAGSHTATTSVERVLLNPSADERTLRRGVPEVSGTMPRWHERACPDGLLGSR